MKRLISVALCLCVAIAALFIAVPGFKRQAEANDVNGEAKQLLATYYNNGYYTKQTEIIKKILRLLIRKTTSTQVQARLSA